MIKTTFMNRTKGWCSMMSMLLAFVCLVSFEAKAASDLGADDSTTTGIEIPIGATIALKANNGKYVCSENGRKAMTASRDRIGGWEKFTVEDAGNGKIALKGNNGKYVSSENGKKSMHCNVNGLWGWQKFKVIQLGNGKIALKGSNGKYVSSENGRKPLICNRRRVGSWEKFRVKVLQYNNCEVNPGRITKTQRSCGGFLPNEFTGTEATTNHGEVKYQWQIKENRGGQWENIDGANSINYQPPFAESGSVWYRRAAKKVGCHKYFYSNNVDIHVKKLPEVQVVVTNPDCGQQNGTIEFSFNDVNGRSHIEFSLDGGATYTTVKDDSNSFAFSNLGQGNYDIWVRWGNDDCPVDLGIVSIVEKSISVDAGEDQELCLGENSEVTLTASVEGASNCVNCEEYAVSNTEQCNRDENYVFWLSDGTSPRWFSNVDLVWSENNDGTATLKGTIFDYTLTQTTYEVDATFTGKTSNPGDDPKAHICNDEDSSNWMYYTGLTGTVTSTDGTWSVDLSRRGPAFQMGNGANQTEKEPGKNGACGWFNTTDSQYDRGDFNFNFGDCITTSDEEIEYLWSTGETTQSITVSPDEDTTYTVTATSCDGCVASDDVTVTVTSIDVDAGDDMNVCLGDEVTLTASGEGTFEWSTGETTQSITVNPTETTTYTVTLTNGDCEATDEVTVVVEELAVDAGADQSICPGETVVLTAQGTEEGKCETCVSYAITNTDYCFGNQDFVFWMKEDSGQRRWFSNVDLVWTVNDADGTATLTGTIYDHFFSKENFEVDITFTGKTTLPPPGSPTLHNCNNEDVSGWIYYEELNGTVTQEDGSLVLNISRRGEAFQIGNGANNFETEEAKNGGSGWLNVDGGFSGIGDININFGDCIATEANSVEYLWSNGETGQSITVSPTETTTYSVTLSNCDDCEGTDEVSVIVNDYSIDLGNDVTITQGDTTTLSLGVAIADSFLWSTGETTPSITVSPDVTTTYTLTTTFNGCTATDSINVHVETTAPTSVFDPCVAQEFEVTATPIPVSASGIMNVDVAVDANQDIAYEIYLGANPVSQGTVTPVQRGCNSFTINLSQYALQPGTTYILLVNGSGWTESIQFITE